MAQAITIDSITPPGPYCSGAQVTVHFTASTLITNVNIQLSNNNGGFMSNVVALGNVSVNTNNSTSYSQVVNLSPAQSLSGCDLDYKIRISSIQANNTFNNAITICPAVSISSQPPTLQSICVAGSDTIGLTAQGGSAPLAYGWQYATSSTGPWSNVANSTPAGASYSNTATQALTVSGINAVGSYFYRCIVSDNGTGCGPDTSNVSRLTVNPQVTLTNPSFNPATICAGGVATTSVTPAGGVAPYSYQWQYNNANVVNGTPSGAVYTGANSGQLKDSAITQPGTYQYRCLVTPSGNGCTTQTSSAASLTVVADPTVTLSKSNDTICTQGSSLVVASASGGIGNASYQWQYNNAGTWAPVVDGTPSGADYTGGINDSLTITGITATGTREYRCVVTQNTGSGCVGFSSNFALRVNNGPTATISQFAPATICTGGSSSVQVSVSGGGVGVPSYQWQFDNGTGWVNVNNNQPAGAQYSGANTATLSVSNVGSAGAHKYRCVVTQGGTCNANSSDAILTVVSDPQVTITPPVVTICKGGNLAFTANGTGGTPPLSYFWQFNNGGQWVTPGSGSPAGSSYSGSNTSSFSVSGVSVSGSFQYRAVVSALGNGCGTDTATTNLMVVEDPQIVEQPAANVGICPGSSFNLIVRAINGAPSVVYNWQFYDGAQWVNVSNNVPVGFTYLSSATDTLRVSTSQQTDTLAYRFRCQISASASGCDAVLSNESTVKVHREPYITNQITQIAPVCQGGVVKVWAKAAGGVPGSLLYQWWRSSTAVADGQPAGTTYAGQVTDTLSILTDQSFNSPQPYLLQVTSVVPGCDQVSSNIVLVIVVRDPYFTALPQDTVICAGNGFGFNVLARCDSLGVQYDWQHNSPGGWQSVTSNVPVGTQYTGGNAAQLSSPTAQNTPADTLAYRCRIYASGEGCTDTFANAKVIINRLPAVPFFAVEDDTVCSGALGVALALTNDTLLNTPPLYYLWSTTPGGLAASGLQSAFAQVDFEDPGTYQVKLEVGNAANCANQYVRNVVVLQDVAPQAAVIMQQTGSNQTLIVTDNSFDSYQWGYDDNPGLQQHLFANEVFQSYNTGGALNTTGRYYWVLVCKDGCCSRIYYNPPPKAITTIETTVADEGLLVYPVPSSNVLWIHHRSELLKAVSIFDLSGKLVTNISIEARSEFSVDISGLQDGVYLGLATGMANRQYQFKVIVKK